MTTAALDTHTLAIPESVLAQGVARVDPPCAIMALVGSRETVSIERLVDPTVLLDDLIETR